MKNSSNLKSKVFSLANVLHWNKGLSKSEAFRKAWKVIKLKEAMQNNRVDFTYQKKDGSTRNAVGTTSNQFFNYTRRTERPSQIAVITYFDIEKQAFRAFKAENIILDAA